MTTFRSACPPLVLALAAALSPASYAKAVEPAEACRIMMGKLAIEYEMQRLNVERDTTGFWTTQKTARSMTSGAYRVDRAELEKKWPGLWDYAFTTSLDALTNKTPVSDFEPNAFLGCMQRWG